jgi:hypothetical protein
LTDRSPLVAFAGITPAFEAAYAGRIARDADGTITGVDARPFNAAHEDREDLRLAVVFSRNFGGGSGPSVPGKEGLAAGTALAPAARCCNSRWWTRSGWWIN